MTSKLESTLLEDDRDDGSIRRTLFAHLSEGNSLPNLRLSSHLLQGLVDQRKSHLFRRLHVHLPLRRQGSSPELAALKRIAPFCTALMFIITPRHTPSADPTRQAKDAFESGLDPRTEQKLRHILSHIQHVREVNIRIHGDSDWPGPTPTDDILVTLRLALQRASLPKLRSLRVDTLHAAGVMYMRWAGFGAFTSPFAPRQTSSPPTQIWTSLAELDLRIRNPVASRKLSDNQMMMFLQVLEDYLRSFHRTLRCLRFVWLDVTGPSPLIFGDLLERKHLIWQNLREFSYGNINGANHSLEVLSVRMPQVRSVKVLRTSSTPSTDIWDTVQLPKGKKPLQEYPLSAEKHPKDYETEISLMPAPLAVVNRNNTVHPALRSRRASIISTISTVFDAPDIDQAIRDIRDTTDPTPATGLSERKLVPKFRMPVASSVYSCDEDGNYIPVRQKWNRNSQLVNAAERGKTALLDSGRRLSKSLTMANLHDLSHSEAPLRDEHDASGGDKREAQVVEQGKSIGHEPPTVPPATSKPRKAHIEIGKMPAYRAAQDQRLKELQEIQLAQPARIRQWAKDIKSGRPPSFVTMRSVNTVSTTGSRPFTKFIEHLRETGRPSRR
ncbi:hypothetical protein CB0940_10435 [Cercospora beticola]|uniref:Uncharacterized protein n=1 Tax=Cercospora beticola TaxID=122368 RepID=A0A2G5HTY7_CERBT|nr:hypothetical protein CB0940_10435 [Cercospora beticola]PIA96000.1 hypothetical protein CB0940_10435 [Cercospora beticola]WPB07152.1 hypothetical protein RHO25_011812 [Cercospora beticola]CAK1367110.1 unnamed protein product [Cercospora beticola]